MNDVIKRIIMKHNKEILFMVKRKPNAYEIKSGYIQTLNDSKILLKSDISANEIIEEKFDNGIDDRILHLYSLNKIDLLVAKETPTLAMKLKIRENQSAIITKLKPYINKDLYIVWGNSQRISLVYGKFANMGISGLSIKPAPFYNRDENVDYKNILHIFESTGYDLIKI